MKKNDKRALAASIIGSGLDDMNVMFLSFSLSSIIADLNLSGSEAGWIGTITNLGMLLGGLLFGVLADRYNKFNVFKLTVFIYSLATGLIYFADNIYLLYLLRFISGIGVGGEYGVAISVMAGIVPLSKMGRVSSLNGIVGQIGSISSAILAAWIAPSLGWRGLFLFGFLPIGMVLWAHFFIDAEAITERGADERASIKQNKPKIKELFETPALTRLTISLMVMATVQIAGYFGMMNWLPTMMQSQLGISVSDSSQWMIATILGMCLGMFVFGQILDRIGPRKSFSIFLVSSAVSVYLFTMANTSWMMILGGAIVGFFVNGMFTGYAAVTTLLYPQRIRTIANNTILNVGRAVGGFSSVIIGMILEKSGVPMVMFFLASLYVLSLMTMLSIPDLKKENYMEASQPAEN
ncbi:MAG TPA: MFS transporter [Candidatus Atopostipes pullistercoris]|uniref:MFS transporter n=1 Tax=Candidatus Atopostipes pullistercoris TaxID=2838467 RepID=A0A9D2G2A2_9LACT|nr:MFS transporter [Candidatus Atopostipes pullistercoris]